MWILDRVVITVASGAIFIRLGNFINSEIIGKVTNSPLGARFIQEEYTKREAMQLTGLQTPKEAYNAIANNPQFQNLLDAVPYRHPAQLYESFAYVFVFLILWYIYTKTTKSEQTGFLFGLFLVLLWTIRFFVEFVKEAQVDERATWFLNTGQWLSIPFIILGLYFMLAYKPKNTVK